MEKNLKHGIKCGKRDVSLFTLYCVGFKTEHNIRRQFETKLEAINFLSNCLKDGYSSDQFVLIKVQSLKF